MRSLAIFALPVLLAIAPGCSKGCGGRGGGAEERTQVSVSIFPIYDLVRRVAGPDADVKLVLPPGHTEHSFDPTPKDIEAVSKAKLGVMVGLGLDPWMAKLLADAAPKARVIKVGARVPTLTVKDDPIGDDEVHAAAKGKPAAGEPEHGRGPGGGKDKEKAGHDDHDKGDHDKDDHDHDKGATDPHVWLDPTRARLIVRAVAEELGRVDSAHAIAYRQRATELDQSLDALDKEVDERTKALKTRGFVTFHGSFQYFADRYKLEILGVIEPFPGSQPSGEYIAKVLDVIKKKDVKALYREPQLDPRPAKVLADEAKIPLGVLDPVGGSAETDSYEKMIRFDVAQLEKHLR